MPMSRCPRGSLASHPGVGGQAGSSASHPSFLWPSPLSAWPLSKDALPTPDLLTLYLNPDGNLGRPPSWVIEKVAMELLNQPPQ